jgi:hypothetical protein
VSAAVSSAMNAESTATHGSPLRPPGSVWINPQSALPPAAPPGLAGGDRFAPALSGAASVLLLLFSCVRKKGKSAYGKVLERRKPRPLLRQSGATA